MTIKAYVHFEADQDDIDLPGAIESDSARIELRQIDYTKEPHIVVTLESKSYMVFWEWYWPFTRTEGIRDPHVRFGYPDGSRHFAVAARR